MKFRKITALLLVLCMLLSLSISAFAAEADEHTIYDSAPDEETVVSNEAATSGTIQNSGIRWSLDEKGWLTISGSGEAPVFQSADDQPWAAVRDQITEVWFEDVETLSIPDLAYWFEGCVNLTTAELPLAPTIGRHAFYNCPKLSTLTMYYGETVLNSIGEDAFWREADSGDTLYIGYMIGYPKSSVPFHTYDWAASNRANAISMIFMVYIRMRMLALLRPTASRKRRVSLFSPPAPSLATALHAESIRSRAHTLKSHILRAVMQTITSVTPATTSSTLALTPIRATARAPTVPALVRTAAAIRGCCKVSRRLPAPAMATEAILVPAVRPRTKPSTQPVTATAMVRGSSIRPVSIGAQALAETAAQQTMTTLRTV